MVFVITCFENFAFFSFFFFFFFLCHVHQFFSLFFSFGYFQLYSRITTSTFYFFSCVANMLEKLLSISFFNPILHSERPKLYTILAFLSAIGLTQQKPVNSQLTVTLLQLIQPFPLKFISILQSVLLYALILLKIQ